MAGVSLTVLPVDAERLAATWTLRPRRSAWPNAAARPQTPRKRPLADSADAAPIRSAASRGTAGRSRPRLAWSERSWKREFQAATNALVAAAQRKACSWTRRSATETWALAWNGALAPCRKRCHRTHWTTPPAPRSSATGATSRRALGGTSGPLYAAFFLRASGVLRRKQADDPETWAEAFQAGCAAISELGGAGRGDCTMLDALLPAAETFAEAVKAGRSGSPRAFAQGRRRSDGRPRPRQEGWSPRRGRSSYLADRAVGHPDPGSEAVAVWLAAIVRS